MMCWVGLNVVSGGLTKEGWEKRTMTQVVVRFRDVLAGPPTSWVPPGVSPSLNPSSSKNEPPTSLWRGEGRVRLGCVRACLLGVVSIEPTSLERGEGLISG